jgi:hypothetical protein
MALAPSESGYRPSLLERTEKHFRELEAIPNRTEEQERDYLRTGVLLDSLDKVRVLIVLADVYKDIDL